MSWGALLALLLLGLTLWLLLVFAFAARVT